ncbi:MAG: hypothetical protein H8E41_02330 [Desulfobulbaceae bacterium]|uniref:PepSY domain-containing protein n=1 Tax=Candidatus Desulfobia pelagia TaxID=2841692 RepID=A0A8J6NCK6_9BACT|nr:hypothetical protein [Candidatus Desulfobia pelagia]
MRKFILCLITLLTLIAPAAYGGGGGVDEYVSEKEILSEAIKGIASIVEKEKIPSSWGQIKPESSSEKMGKNGLYQWTVIFKNMEIEDPEKQTLYVTLNTAGQILRVNYSGK